jgi:LysR family hydrogen peroxide-inducible transcriptional activator
MIEHAPQMPLVLQENFTTRLLELLRQGELDAAIVALPLPESGFMTLPVYDEPFVVAVPNQHAWCSRKSINSNELKSETMLLLGNGHCFRDQVLEVCPEMARFATSDDGIARTFEGSSLETIRHMVASGIGITVLPKASAPNATSSDGMLHHIPFEEPAPMRQVALVWRKSFTRNAAITKLQQVILQCNVPGVTMLPEAIIS